MGEGVDVITKTSSIHNISYSSRTERSDTRANLRLEKREVVYRVKGYVILIEEQTNSYCYLAGTIAISSFHGRKFYIF